MKPEDNVKPSDEQPVVEDLTVDEGQAGEVKGSGYYPGYALKQQKKC